FADIDSARNDTQVIRRTLAMDGQSRRANRMFVRADARQLRRNKGVGGETSERHGLAPARKNSVNHNKECGLFHSKRVKRNYFISNSTALIEWKMKRKPYSGKTSFLARPLPQWLLPALQNWELELAILRAKGLW